jgi:hypothetical protein
MNNRERFLAVARGERPDYVPIFGFGGAPGVSLGAMRPVVERLIEQGMPEWVGGIYDSQGFHDVESWMRYWGTTTSIWPDFAVCDPPAGYKSETRIENGFEIVETELGGLTKQVINNDITYSMPHFIRHDVRDRKSWELYREKMTPGPFYGMERLEADCKRFDVRERPLEIGAGGTWCYLRAIMGTVRAAQFMYEDPMLIHEIMEWLRWQARTYTIPLIERLRPEIVSGGEDVCGKNGMIISPALWREFCAPLYKEVSDAARDCGVPVYSFDDDGNVMQLVPVLEECGVNCLYPFEVKAGNDLFALRKTCPNFIMMGWLEKEILNEGNEHMIEPEIMSKVPALLKMGRYFPNADHGIQPLITYKSLCKFMTLLHRETGNPEGEYPRV